jgi:hypothetical protein
MAVAVLSWKYFIITNITRYFKWISGFLTVGSYKDTHFILREVCEPALSQPGYPATQTSLTICCLEFNFKQLCAQQDFFFTPLLFRSTIWIAFRPNWVRVEGRMLLASAKHQAHCCIYILSKFRLTISVIQQGKCSRTCQELSSVQS